MLRRSSFIFLLAAVSCGPSDPWATGFGPQFKFPVTDQFRIEYEHQACCGGLLGFGEWCAVSLVDSPNVVIDNHFSSMNCKGANDKVTEVRNALDTPGALSTLRKFEDGPDGSIDRLDQAAAIVYLADSLGSPWKRAHPNCLRSARDVLVSAVSRDNGSQSSEFESGIACLILEKTEADFQLQVGMVRRLSISASGSNAFLGLRATTELCYLEISHKKFRRAQQTAKAALRQFVSLADWMAYGSLQQVARDPKDALILLGHEFDGIRPR